ncbi:hypothetical protein ES705_02725 [subsurface metagenome]
MQGNDITREVSQMKFLLKMKAWQIFLILVGVPYVLPIIMMSVAKISSVYFNAAIIILFVGLYVGWLWTLGVNLNKKVHDNFKLKSGFFKSAMVYNLIYALFFAILFVQSFSYIRTLNSEPSLNRLGVIAPFHIIAMICMFYGLTFVARALVTAEKQTKVKADDYIGVFFMLWFFPIGIWWVQPRVNKLFKSD